MPQAEFMKKRGLFGLVILEVDGKFKNAVPLSTWLLMRVLCCITTRQGSKKKAAVYQEEAAERVLTPCA